ncbi:MAG: putative DNA binding domain-containing protein [Oscillospiraceae bacterium]|jgi:ATP-dependent DNA helicase RecG|nr:putative DNA binding domain-containing protein [Oscillospiraceae bacterium]
MINKLQQLLRDGEGLTVEFKRCKSTLPKSVYETVCSFSNRYGGYILLGVDDDGTVSGVAPEAVQGIKKDFVTSLNNPQKISPTLLLNLEEAAIDDKPVLYVYIPQSSQVVLCANHVFDRTEDADVDITKSTDLTANLYRRKSTQYTEQEIIKYVTERELRLDLMPKVRQIAVNLNPDHRWKNMSNMEIFCSAGLYAHDWRTDTEGFNLAAILLFGRDDVIRSCLPGYTTDAIMRCENIDRFDDRLTVETNLIESYDLLIDFMMKHTLDRFFLIDNQRVSVNSWIAREIVSNSLVHREYTSAFPAKIVIERSRIYAENWNKAQWQGRIDPDNFTPYPKNPLLARFFVNIGRADKLGSGVRNLYKYTKIYSGGEPELIEGDVFRTIVPLRSLHK